MRLSMIYFLNKVKPHGKLFRGKNRKVKNISMKELSALRQDYEREERNMFYLRHPYLTSEQSRGHMLEAKAQRPNVLERFQGYRVQRFSKKYTFADALVHLRVKEAWD